MSVPSLRDEYANPKMSNSERMIIFMRDSGILRLVFDNLKAMYGLPVGEADDMERAIACRHVFNKNVISENVHTAEAMDEILSMPLPTVPTIQYVSTQSSGFYPEWEPGHQDFVDASENGKLIKLDCRHGSMYMEEHDRIVKDIKEFLKTL